MPCPYFEPQRIADHPQHSNARLPLIDEYDGSCRAMPEPLAVPADHRFGRCNHGYSRGCCQYFPAAEARSSFRYTVLKQSAAALDLLCIEEQNYAPVRWHATQYLAESGRLEPELADACMRAQALAFCRSYVERFPLRA
jgi:hypothetical protein